MAVRVVRDFRVQIKAKYRANAEAAFDKAAENTVATAQSLVPVRTGALHASIVAQNVGPLKRRVSAGNEAVGYAAYVELGTSTQAAQPFLFPAAEQAIPDLISELKKSV